MNTVEEAGFEHRMGYWAHSDYNNDGNTQRGERFFILSPDDNRSTIKPAAGTAYVQQYSGYYNDRQWRDTPTYTGVEKNSIFHPNYEIIIDSKAVNASS
jgi:spermidine synthase